MYLRLFVVVEISQTTRVEDFYKMELLCYVANIAQMPLI